MGVDRLRLRQSARLAQLPAPPSQVMNQRIHAGRFDVGISRKVGTGVEIGAWVQALISTNEKIVHDRIEGARFDLVIRLQVPGIVKQSGLANFLTRLRQCSANVATQSPEYASSGFRKPVGLKV